MEEESHQEFECYFGEDFTDSERRWFQQSCRNLPSYKNYRGHSYCVLHYPGKEKEKDFRAAIQQKIENSDYVFSAVYFPTDFFLRDKIINSKADFTRATFTSGANFEKLTFDDEVSFTNANFMWGARFDMVTFKNRVSLSSYFKNVLSLKNIELLGELNFNNAEIDARLFIEDCSLKGRVSFYFTEFKKDSHFDRTEFSDVNFDNSTFMEDVHYHNATFHKSQFIDTRFRKYASFRNSTFTKNAHFNHSKFYLTGDFTDAVFESDVNFTGAAFGIVELKPEKCQGAYFENSYFQGFAVFENTTFEYASFRWAFFEKEGVFRKSVFSLNADFTDSHFKATANFKSASFRRKAIFESTILEGELRFTGSAENLMFADPNALSLNEVRLSLPEKIKFHTVRLRPSWFLDIDCRNFVFTRISWENANGKPEDVKKELKNVANIKGSRHLFIITCRQLAQNLENYNDLERASSFRRMAFETEWLEIKEKLWYWVDKLPIEFEKLKRRFGGSKNPEDKAIPPVNSFGILRTFDFVHLLYRFTSYYGESWRLAFFLLVGILLLWSLLYSLPVCNFANKPNESYWYWVGYSLNVVTLQRPDPKPGNAFTAILLGIEVLFVPIQAALLILAVRRKFMR